MLDRGRESLSPKLALFTDLAEVAKMWPIQVKISIGTFLLVDVDAGGRARAGR
jgi:hypothetical protein